jgi:hypothetical protein
MGRVRYARKPSIQEKYMIFTVYQLVFLFDKQGKFLNVWHKSNVERAKPGTLDINEGKHNE